MGYLFNLGIITAIAALGTMSMNIAAGFTGLMNLGHAAFVGIGAYATTLLMLKAGAHFLPALIASILVSVAVAAVLGAVSRRLRHESFAVLMLWFAFVVTTVLLNWTELTRGALGIPGIRRPAELADFGVYFFFTAGLTLLVYLLLKKITSSPFGRVMGAVRDDETAALVLGKNVFRVRLAALMISAGAAAIPGSLIALHLGYIDPMTFGVPMLTLYLFLLIVGGMASLEGSILAAVIISLLLEVLQFLQISPDIIGPLRQIIFSVILLLVIMFRPKGLLGKAEL